MEMTSLSSRGQIVIPQKIREKLKLKEGEKFFVAGEGDSIVLKRATFEEEFDRLFKITHEWAAKSGITPQDVEDAIKKVRNESRSRH